jgi:maltose O-acetyltransferase
MNNTKDYDEYLSKRGRNNIISFLIKLTLYINSTLNFSAWLRIKIYRFVGVNIPGIEEYPYIAREVLIDDNFPEMVTIEDGAAIGWRVIFLCHNTLSDEKIVAPIYVKKKAMIGAGAIIMPGVTIGEYATVGAGTVVTKDVPAYGIIRGPSPILKLPNE